MYEQLSESSRTLKTMELSDVDGQIEQKMEQKYSENLQQLRQEYEDDLKRNKEDLRKLFEEKVRATTPTHFHETRTETRIPLS